MNPPENLAKYYSPEKYYSFRGSYPNPVPLNPLRRWLKRFRDRAACFNRGGLAGRVAQRFPNEDATTWRRWLKHTSLQSPHERILDVGCGGGWHLFQLQSLGFTSLTGVDPYLSDDVLSEHVRIHACPISDLSGQKFDLITMHHSLEHMPDQLAAMQQISRLLAPGGDCMIRIPIVSRGPWKMFETDWAEIDAPRHFVLHSEMSLQLVAEQAGLTIKCVQYESEPFTYAASELYRRDLSLYDDVEKRQRSLPDFFGPEEWRQFEILSKRHLIPGWAGRAAFFLTRRRDQEVTSDLSQ